MRLFLLFIALLSLCASGCKRKAAVNVPLPNATPHIGNREIPQTSAYVDDQTCADCHPAIAEQFAKHPMGRSMGPIGDVDWIEEFGDNANATVASGAFQYDVTRTADGMEHRQTLTGEGEKIATTQSVALAIGSGQNGRSYLINHDDYLFMSPLTWYPKSSKWDLSPGYEHNDLGFDRPVLEDCLFCHANRAEIVPQMQNKYTEPVSHARAIGCQRCHGPGELHVQRQSADASPQQETYDTTIVNPGRLEPHLREAVCQQCHLAGVARVNPRNKRAADFRPGEPLESTIATFVLQPSEFEASADHFVGQVEQMYASHCFVASDGQLGCISCHDPHTTPAPEQQATFYRNRCLRCHQVDSCALTETDRLGDDRVDNCVACHMPRLETDVRHAAVTNHRIPRSNERHYEPPLPTKRQLPLIAFPPRSIEYDQLRAGREQAMALLQAAPYHPRRFTPEHFHVAAEHLERVVSQRPDDWAAQEALGDLRTHIGKHLLASESLESVIQLHPNRERSVVAYASLLSKMGRLDEARVQWEHAVQLNPWIPGYQSHLASTFASLHQWNDTIRVAATAVERFPTHASFHQLLANGHRQRGDDVAALRALETFIRTRPEEEEAIRAWFAEIDGP